MTWKTSLVLTVALACGSAPAAASELTLHGAPISGTVDVYRLAAPAIESVVEPEQQPPPEEEEPSVEEERHALWPIGMMIGGAAGCGIAAGLVFGPSGSESDEFPAACGLLAAAGGVAGALVMIAVR